MIEKDRREDIQQKINRMHYMFVNSIHSFRKLFQTKNYEEKRHSTKNAWREPT